jgi:hypothetical protein
LLFEILVNTNDSFAQSPRSDIKGDYLLETQWGGNEKDFHLFYKYSPNNYPNGCHSVAIAQILFYHKLAPFGKVNYKCRKGFVINEDFSDYTFDWKKIATALADSSSQEIVDATARFLYSVACIVQKDFGTNQYVDIENSENHKTQIEKHFNCKYESYTYNTVSSILVMFKKNKSIEKRIKKEIDAKKPIGFYYDGPDFDGHAVVINGYIIKDKRFYAHVNFGWSGDSDGWYLMPEDLPKDTKNVILLTIDPN